MKKFFLIAGMVVLAWACKKDEYQTNPKISIKSITPTRVQPGSAMVTILRFTDKEGDVGGGQIIVIRNRLNRRPLASNYDKTDTIRNAVPDFPKESLGEINVTLEYSNFLKESPIENDTLILKFAVQDKKGNKSDTISTDKIVILQ
ncbi:MAG: hypothetical protein INR73_01635 [Williamsia sp.]|nr:hypothetical protein [Williamsia sp.]